MIHETCPERRNSYRKAVSGNAEEKEQNSTSLDDVHPTDKKLEMSEFNGGGVNSGLNLYVFWLLFFINTFKSLSCFTTFVPSRLKMTLSSLYVVLTITNLNDDARVGSLHEKWVNLLKIHTKTSYIFKNRIKAWDGCLALGKRSQN